MKDKIFNFIKKWTFNAFILFVNVVVLPLYIAYMICKSICSFIWFLLKHNWSEIIVIIIFISLFIMMLYDVQKEREEIQIVECYLADHGFKYITVDNNQYNAAEILVIKRLDNELGAGKYSLLTTNLNGKMWYKVNTKHFILENACNEQKMK